MLDKILTWYDGLSDGLVGSLVLFIVGALLLIKGGDWFVDSAVGIAKRFRVPEIVIGATVVSVGTTLPEVMVSLTAALNSNSAIAYGNSIGSIICNTALIAALTVAIRPAPIERRTLVAPVSFFFISATVYSVAAYVFGHFDRWLGIVMLLIFGAYMAVTLKSGLRGKSDAEESTSAQGGSMTKNIALIVVSAALIALGADMLESSSVSLATMAGIPTEVVGVTVVALCTSLPELVTAITALIKGYGALSLGNIIGANIFNLVLVTGVSATISPFAVPEGSKLFGMNTSQIFEIPIMIAAMAVLTLPALAKGGLKRWQGVTLLAVYSAFIVLQVLIALNVV